MFSHAVLAVVAATLLLKPIIVSARPPLRLTIDCTSRNKHSPLIGNPSAFGSRFDVQSFCNLIHTAIPKAVKDGKFLLLEEPDQIGFGDNQVSFAVPPPKNFIPKYRHPKLKTPKVQVPRLKVPKLRPYNKALTAPRVGSSMSFSAFRDSAEEESSAERMEKFKKGVQKLLHVVKVLGQIDQYLSERTRIIVEKLSKTLAE